jgi:endonuclease G
MHQALEAIIDDQELAQDLIETATSSEGLPKARDYSISGSTIERAMDPKDKEVTFSNRPLTEAIVVEFGRPALLVRNDTFELPQSSVWRSRLLPSRVKIEQSLKAVGRIELTDHPDFEWVGTGWMVSDDVLITNRHVAVEFAKKTNKGYAFLRSPFGGNISARVDFKEEHNVANVAEIEIAEILFIEEADGPDMALMRVKGGALPAPVALQTKKPENWVAVVGYPAHDSRNGEKAMRRIFGDIFDVKRLSPGQLKTDEDAVSITHDCTTLGGNSGSAVIDVSTGAAVGLHYAGRFRKANFAVKAAVVEKGLRALKIVIPVPAAELQVDEIVEKPRLEDYADRSGYQEAFLGPQFTVPLPTPVKKLRPEVAATKSTKRPGVLDYMHFSTVMHKTRNLCLYSVVNIDGGNLRRVPGGRSWRQDPRLSTNDQTGPAVYASNDLDRGHIVRRLDPVWGNDAEARRANDDTFHFTNSCPQVSGFNAGIWNDLEDYLLDNADMENLRMSVFTGPVLDAGDKAYRDVQLPRRFWKIAVMVSGFGANRKLQAAGFLLSQAELLTAFEAFRLGQGRTEQVSIREIEKLTGLGFAKLRAADTMPVAEGTDRIVIEALDAIRINRRGREPRAAGASHGGRT